MRHLVIIHLHRSMARRSFSCEDPRHSKTPGQDEALAVAKTISMSCYCHGGLCIGSAPLTIHGRCDAALEQPLSRRSQDKCLSTHPELLQTTTFTEPWASVDTSCQREQFSIIMSATAFAARLSSEPRHPALAHLAQRFLPYSPPPARLL